VVAVLVIGVLAILGVLATLSVWHPEWFSTPMAAPKPPVRRATRVIGFAVVAAGVSIMFLPVSADGYSYGEGSCGTGWQAMFTNVNEYHSGSYACGHAAFPHLWIRFVHQPRLIACIAGGAARTIEQR
jgi:hypothetical protein